MTHTGSARNEECLEFPPAIDIKVAVEGLQIVSGRVFAQLKRRGDLFSGITADHEVKEVGPSRRGRKPAVDQADRHDVVARLGIQD